MIIEKNNYRRSINKQQEKIAHRHVQKKCGKFCHVKMKNSGPMSQNGRLPRSKPKKKRKLDMGINRPKPISINQQKINDFRFITNGLNGTTAKNIIENLTFASSSLCLSVSGFSFSLYNFFFFCYWLLSIDFYDFFAVVHRIPPKFTGWYLLKLMW